MQASTYLLFLTLLAGCGSAPEAEAPPLVAVQAVPAARGPIVEGRRYLAEVVPERTVRVLAQVPGAVSNLNVSEGVPVKAGQALIHISAPDIAARISRVQAERKRAQRERDFACDQLETDRTLVAAGDMPAVQLDRSEKGCASANLAVEAAQAGEREASVAGSKSSERAPFDGEILTQLVDQGQTVMPGTPLLQFGSTERQLKIRVPERDLVDVALGARVDTELGSGKVVEIGAQALGPGRLIAILVQPDDEILLRPGATLSATLVVDARADTSSVPEAAIGNDDEGSFVLRVEGDRLERISVTTGPQQDGWIAIEPALPPDALVVSGSVNSLDPQQPVLAVTK